jgi:hypothetical protein
MQCEVLIRSLYSTSVIEGVKVFAFNEADLTDCNLSFIQKAGRALGFVHTFDLPRVSHNARNAGPKAIRREISRRHGIAILAAPSRRCPTHSATSSGAPRLHRTDSGERS